MTDPPSICHCTLSKFDFAQVSYCLSEFVSRQSELISYSTRGCGGQEQSADMFHIWYWLFSALRDSLVSDHSRDGLWKGHLLVEVFLLLLMLLLLSMCACACRHIPYHTMHVEERWHLYGTGSLFLSLKFSHHACAAAPFTLRGTSLTRWTHY